MAEVKVTKKIHEFTYTATEVLDDSYFAIDQDQGDGTYQTQKAKWDTLKLEFKKDFSNLQATGVISGGEISVQTPTTFQVTAGTGQFVDHVAKTITEISWPTTTNIVPTYLTTANEQYSYIYINDVGAVAQTNKPFTSGDYGNKIPIGYITHTVTNPADPPSSKIITAVSNAHRKALSQTIEYGFEANVDIQIIVSKPFRLTYGSGADLKLGLSLVNPLIGGEVQLVGAGAFLFSGVDPNHLNISAVSAFGAVYLGYVNTSGNPVIAYTATGFTNPNKYNPPAGDLEDVGTDFWTIQRLYYYPSENIPLVLYGRQRYESLNAASLNIEIEPTEDLEIFSKFLKPTVFMGYLIVKNGATDLSDTDEAIFISALEPRGARYIDNVNCGIVKGGVVADTGSNNITWTTGQIYSICLGVTEDFDAGGTALAGNGVHYVYWEQGSGILTSLTKPSLPKVILARVSIQNGDIVELFQENFLTSDFTRIKEGLDENFGLSVIAGMLVEPDPDVTYALDMRMTAGEFWLNMRVKKSVTLVETRTTPFVRYFHVSGSWSGDTNNEIDTNNYDDGTNRVALPANKWAVGIIVYQQDPQSATSKITWMYPQSFYDNQGQAEAYAQSIQDGTVDVYSLIPPGFASNPPLMAYVFKSGDTTLADPSSVPSRWVDLRPRVGNFAGGGTGYIPAAAQQAFFVGKHGNNGNNGRSWDEAFADIPTAITAIAGEPISPSQNYTYAVVGWDGGLYTGDITIPEWVKVYMPNATVQGNVSAEGNGTLFVREVRNGGITNLNVAGDAFIRGNVFQTDTSDIGIDVANLAGDLNLYFDKIFVKQNSTGIRHNKSTTATTIGFGELELIGDNAEGIYNVNGELNINGGSIKNGPGVSGTSGVTNAGGTCNIYLAGDNTADTPFDEKGGTLNYISPTDGITIDANLNVGSINCGTVISTGTLIATSVQAGLGSFTNVSAQTVRRTDANPLEIGLTGDDVEVSGLLYPTSDGSSGQVITTNGLGTLTFQDVGVDEYGIINRVTTDYTNTLSGTVAIPYDNSIPQNTEGVLMTTVAITPGSTSNFLKVTAQLMLTSNPAGAFMTIAIFRAIGAVPEANAVAAIGQWIANANGPEVITLSKVLAITSTSSHVFSVRFGTNVGPTSYLNGNGQRYGGVANSFIRVEELVPVT